MIPDARVDADTLDDLAAFQPVLHGVAVELVEISHPHLAKSLIASASVGLVKSVGTSSICPPCCISAADY